MDAATPGKITGRLCSTKHLTQPRCYYRSCANQCSLPQVIASDSWKASNRMPVAFTASSEAK
jgi:hypothetical protein